MSDETARPEDYEVIQEMRRQQAATAEKAAEYDNVIGIEEERKRLRAEGQKPNGKLALRAARLPDPDTLEPRRWLYGTQLVRGAVTVLVAPGGTGKSAYAMAVGVALAAKRPVLGDLIFDRVNVAIFNLDDPMDELERRVAAIMIAHKIKRDELDGRLFLEDCDGHRLCVAAQEKDEAGFFIANPDEKAIIELIKENNIGLVVCDPFAESHSLEENSNPHMVAAAAAWRRIARATNCAILLVHHVRKGDAAGSIDAARGAKALTDSARAGLLMTTMSTDEAEQFSIHDDDRLAYVRLDDAKRNMAPAGKAKWFKLQSVRLGNTFNPTYPNGDSVGAIVQWKPPEDELKNAPTPDINSALDAIRAGPEPGLFYRASKRGGGNWCGNVLIQMFRTSEKQAKNMISQWLKSGLLYEEEYNHPVWRRPAWAVRVNDTLRPS